MDRPWYAHYDRSVPPHLDYPEVTLPALFAETAAAHSDRVATIFHGRRLTYRRLQRQIGAFAANLQRLGVQPGDRVAVMLPNMPQFPVAFFGALRAGAIVVPTNPLYTQHELEHQLADAGASAVVTVDPLFGRMQAALPATGVRIVIVAGIGEALPLHLRPPAALKQRRQGTRKVRPGGIVHRFSTLLRDAPLQTEPRPAPDDVAVLQYTGGTTGRSKGAMLTHRNLVANALQAKAWQAGLEDRTLTFLCAAPFFHVYGLTIGMNTAVAAGATMVLIPRWNPKGVAAAIRRYRPEIFPGVPTMYVALLDLPGIGPKWLGSLEICMSGAAPLSPEVQRRFQELSGARVIEGYGLTEAGPVTHCNPVEGKNHIGTVGIPFPDTDATITDPDTWEPLPPGAIGEMTVRGPQVMKGYWNRPEETLAVLRDGWLHTGDIATMDEEGYFLIVDRKKDVILASGYNVYPREVEEALHLHPAVREAAVVGVHSPYRGETVKAVVVLEEGVSATPAEIIAHCRERLAAYKAPRIVEFTDELPKTLIGKVLRRELREPSVDATAGQQMPVA